MIWWWQWEYKGKYTPESITIRGEVHIRCWEVNIRSMHDLEFYKTWAGFWLPGSYQTERQQIQFETPQHKFYRLNTNFLISH